MSLSQKNEKKIFEILNETEDLINDRVGTIQEILYKESKRAGFKLRPHAEMQHMIDLLWLVDSFMKDFRGRHSNND